MTTPYREDPDLWPVLGAGSADDLGVLVDVITDNGEGRLMVDTDVKTSLLSAKAARSFTVHHLMLVASEIQQFGGNTLINIVRGGKGVPYREIVCDVADHVGAKYNDHDTIDQIEMNIVLRIAEKAVSKMSEQEQEAFFEAFGAKYPGAGPAAMGALIAAIRASGFKVYQMAAILAASAAKAFTGKAMAFGGAAPLMNAIKIFSGPLGIILTGVWTAFDLASPAYRVTVPCVIQLAYMRQQMLTTECASCHARQPVNAKFCSECGAAMQGVSK